MASPRASGDLPIALALLTAGAVAVTVASLRNPAAFHFVPAMDGCLTAGCIGFCLALLAGAPFRQALLLLLPIVGVQVVGTQVHHASLLGALGVEALVVGLIGAAIGLLQRSNEPAPQPKARRRERPEAPVSRRAHPVPAS